MNANIFKGLQQFVAAAVMTMIGAGSAHAGAYTGTWDPAFSATFSGPFGAYGWKVSAKIVIPDACGTTGTIYNGQGCAPLATPMSMEQVNLRFYALASPGTILETISFGTYGLNSAFPAPAAAETQEITAATFWVGTPTMSSTYALRQASTLFPGYYFSFALNTAGTGASDPHLVYTTLPPPPSGSNFDLYNADYYQGFRSDPGGTGAGTVPLTYIITALGNNQYVDPFAPVPEPGTWVLMLAGLSAVGLMAKRRIDPAHA